MVLSLTLAETHATTMVHLLPPETHGLQRLVKKRASMKLAIPWTQRMEVMSLGTTSPTKTGMNLGMAAGRTAIGGLHPGGLLPWYGGNENESWSLDAPSSFRTMCKVGSFFMTPTSPTLSGT